MPWQEMAFVSTSIYLSPGRGVARCPTEVGRLSSLFDQSIPARLQIMMFSPLPRSLPLVTKRQEGHWITRSRGTVSRERVMTTPGANYFAMR